MSRLVVMAEVTDQSVFVFCALSYSFYGTIATNVTSLARVQKLPRCSVGTELWHEFELQTSWRGPSGGTSPANHFKELLYYSSRLLGRSCDL